MPRTNHTQAAKSRSGPTQPEDRRTARQLLLRLRPEAIDAAEFWPTDDD